MGSDLYIAVDVLHDNGQWSHLWEGPSTDLARGIVIDAFGDADPDATTGDLHVKGHLTHAEWTKMAEHPECPWRLDEPYWVRKVPGDEFVAIVRERRWRLLQDGDFHDTQCSALLRAFAALVDALRAEGLGVRVWCWHSQ